MANLNGISLTPDHRLLPTDHYLTLSPSYVLIPEVPASVALPPEVIGLCQISPFSIMVSMRS